MKIFVQSSDVNLKLWFPNSLILSGFVRRKIIYQVYRSSKEKIPFSPAALDSLLICLKEISYEYKGLNLVEVSSADGTFVLIQL